MKKNTLIAGFTLVEALVYVAIVGVLAGVLSVFLINVLDSYRRVAANNMLEENAKVIARTIEGEARYANGIYIPTSTFSTDPGQISFESSFYLPAGETAAYVDIYADGGKIYLKREGQAARGVSSDNVFVNEFIITSIGTASIRADYVLSPRFKKALLSNQRSYFITASVRGF